MTFQKTFNKISFFSVSLFMSASAFDGGTLITTSSGRLKSIQELKVGDEVICYNSNLQPETNLIKGLYAFSVDSKMNITTADNITITTSLMERFYLPVENQWVCAKDLKEGDRLLNENLEQVAITLVEQLNDKGVLFLLSVDNQHNFLASQGKYLVHNGALGATMGCFLGVSAVQVTYGLLTTAVVTISGPAAPVVLPMWTFWTAAPLAAATNVAGVAGGLALGVATGPV